MTASPKADHADDPAGRPSTSAPEPSERRRHRPDRGRQQRSGPGNERGRQREAEPAAAGERDRDRVEAARLVRRLTRREAQVLARFAAGDDDRAAAAALGIAPATARTHLQKVVRKLGVTSPAEAARLMALLAPPSTGAPHPAARPAPASGAPADTATGVPAGAPVAADSGRTDRERPATAPAAPPTAGAAAGAAPPAPAAPARPGPPEPLPADFAAFTAVVHARLVQQTFLVTGSPRLAARYVRRALGAAGVRWAEVSALPDPEGWVRAAAFESALAPWHRSARYRGGPGRRHRAPAATADGAHDRELLAALRRLSRVRRRAVVLHDAVGLPVPALAAEVEASSAAAEGRVLAARAELARSVPALVGDDPLAPDFGPALGGLLHGTAVRACPDPVRPAPDRLARAARLRAGRATAAAALLTTVMAGAMVAALVDGDPVEQARTPTPETVVAPPPEVCSAAGTGSAGPAVPGRAPGLRSPWCSPAPPEAAAAPPDDTASPAAEPSGTGPSSDPGSPTDGPSDAVGAGPPVTGPSAPAAPSAAVPAGTSRPDGGSLVPVAVPCAPYWPCPTLAPAALPRLAPGAPPAVR